MVINYFSQHDPPTDGLDGFKDSRFKTVLVGYVLPGCVLLVAVGNLLAGRIYWPAGRFGGDLLDGLVQSYDDGWRFWGVVVLKIGVAGALFSWFGLANHERTERFAQAVLLIGIIVGVGGFLAFAIGFFV